MLLSGEIAFDLPLRHQIVLAEKTTHFPTALLNESDSLIQASPLALPFIEKEMDACLLAKHLKFLRKILIKYCVKHIVF